MLLRRPWRPHVRRLRARRLAFCRRNKMHRRPLASPPPDLLSATRQCRTSTVRAAQVRWRILLLMEAWDWTRPDTTIQVFLEMSSCPIAWGRVAVSQMRHNRAQLVVEGQRRSRDLLPTCFRWPRLTSRLLRTRCDSASRPRSASRVALAFLSGEFPGWVMCTLKRRSSSRWRAMSHSRTLSILLRER